jgi:hypothetical protein
MTRWRLNGKATRRTESDGIFTEQPSLFSSSICSTSSSFTQSLDELLPTDFAAFFFLFLLCTHDFFLGVCFYF